MCLLRGGAADRMRVGVLENFAAGPVNGTTDPSDSSVACNISRALVWDFSATSVKVFTRVAGIPAVSNMDSTEAVDRAAHQSLRKPSTSSRLPG